MAIAFVNLGTNANPDINTGSNSSSYSNSSWTPPTDGIIYLWVQSRRNGGPDTPTVSGNGIAWVQIGTTFDLDGGGNGLSLFGAFASGATAGVTTVDFAGNTQTHCVMQFSQVTGADESGTIANTIVQNPTSSGSGASGSVTLAAAGSSDNRPISCFWHKKNEVSTQRTNWTELDDQNGTGQSRSVGSQYRSDAFEVTASASWTTSANWGGTAAEIKAVAGGVTLVVQDATHSHAVEVPVLVQHHVLAANEAAHAQDAEVASLTQVHNLVVQEASHAQTAEQLTLLQTYTLAVDDAAHSQPAEAPALTQSHVLTADETVHSHSADELGLVQHHVLEVQDALHGHVGEAPTLNASTLLVAQDNTHPHSAETLALSQVHALTAQDAAHSQAADASTLTQHHVLIADDAEHFHSADNATLRTAGALVVQDSSHEHHAGGGAFDPGFDPGYDSAVSLVQHHALDVRDSSHSHAVEAPVLGSDTAQAHVDFLCLVSSKPVTVYTVAVRDFTPIKYTIKIREI